MQTLRRFLLSVVFGALALSLACGGGGGSNSGGGTPPPAAPGSPTITSFAANPAAITLGAVAQLTGVFSNGTGVITPGNLSATSGAAVTVTPTVTTTFTLTVTNSAGAELAGQATVNVNAVVPPPTITSFAANPAAINSGGSATLTSVFLNGMGIITPGNLSATSGTGVVVTPTVTTTYTLTVTNSVGMGVTAPATVTVSPALVAPSITAQPTNQTVNSGSSATFTVAASGSPAPTFTWARSNDGGVTWNAISGASSATYTFITAETDNQAQFRGLATNSQGTASSNAAALTVQWLTFTSQPAGQVVTAPNPATFTVITDANPTPTYQWQSSPDGTTWTPVSGATKSSYTTGATSVSDNDTQFQCVISNTASILTSDPAILSVNVVLTAPRFTTQPTNLQAYANNTASFTVAASGYPSPTFTWERSNDSGSTWTAIGGAVSSTYTFTAHTTDSGAEFHAIAANSGGNVTSNPATLTIVPSVYAAYATQCCGFGGYWLNGTWVNLPGVGQVNSLVVSGNNIYCLGNVPVSGVPGYWLNGAWVGLTLPSGSINGAVSSIVVLGGDVYAGGYSAIWAIPPGSTLFTAVPLPGYWLNGTWVALSASEGEVGDMAVSGSNVYWLPEGQGSIAVSGSTVYTATPGPGANATVNGLYYALKGIGYAECIAVSGIDFYVGGFAGGVPSAPLYWLNGEQVSLPLPSGAWSGQVFSIVVNGGNVYAGGNISSVYIGGIYYDGPFPGYWLNGTWVPLTLPPDSTGGSITSLVVQ